MRERIWLDLSLLFSDLPVGEDWRFIVTGPRPGLYFSLPLMIPNRLHTHSQTKTKYLA